MDENGGGGGMGGRRGTGAEAGFAAGRARSVSAMLPSLSTTEVFSWRGSIAGKVDPCSRRPGS